MLKDYAKWQLLYIVITYIHEYENSRTCIEVAFVARVKL